MAWAARNEDPIILLDKAIEVFFPTIVLVFIYTEADSFSMECHI